MRNNIIRSALVDQPYFESLMDNCFALQQLKDEGVNFIVHFQQVIDSYREGVMPIRGSIRVVDILLNSPEEIKAREEGNFTKNSTQLDFIDILNEGPVQLYFDEQCACYDGELELYNSVYATQPRPKLINEIRAMRDVAVDTTTVYEKGYSAAEFLVFLDTYLFPGTVKEYFDNNITRLEKEILEENVLSFDKKELRAFKI